MRRIFLFLSVLVLVGSGCDTAPGESLYDPDRATSPDPIVDQVLPDGLALAGVDVLTINGQNFGDDADMVRVYFDENPGTVVSAAPTSIEVVPPNVPAPALDVRVSVIGAENFSNSFSYGLGAAAESFGEIEVFEEFNGLASDASGNLFGNLFADLSASGNPVGIGIVQFDANGQRQEFTGSTFKLDDLAVRNDGGVFAVRSVRAVFLFDEPGAGQQVWTVLPDRGLRLRAIDIDDTDGYVYTGGISGVGEFYAISPDQDATAHSFAGEVRAMKVHDGTLYVGAVTDGVSQVFAYPIQGDGQLGAAQEVLNVTSFDTEREILSLEVAADGTLYVGTNTRLDPLLVLPVGGTPAVLYPGIMQGVAEALAWGPDTFLYMNQGGFFRSQDDPDPIPTDLVVINTRRQGTP